MITRTVSATVIALVLALVAPANAQRPPTALSQDQIDAVLRSAQEARKFWDDCGTDGKTFVVTYPGILLARAADSQGKKMPETIAASPNPGRVVAVRAYPEGPEFNEQANAYIGGGSITSLVIGTRGGEHVVAPLRIELHEGVWRNLIKQEIGRYQWAEALFDYDTVAALPPGDIHLLAQGNTSVCRVPARKRAAMFE
jgi:hypothetical protein